MIICNQILRYCLQSIIIWTKNRKTEHQKNNKLFQLNIATLSFFLFKNLSMAMASPCYATVLNNVGVPVKQNLENSNAYQRKTANQAW